MIITYFPEKAFNGALIVLREPHKSSEDETISDTIKGNMNWFTSLSGEKLSSLESRYKNRFIEMLKYAKKNNGLKPLLSTAFTNINQSGGGSTASSDYWSIPKEEKESRLKEIIKQVKPDTVFLLKEMFDIVSKGKEKDIREGILYCGCAIPKRLIKINDISFIEILHPSYPRVIHF